MNRTGILILLLWFCASCGREEEPKASETESPPPAQSASTDPRHDYTKPYLTEEKTTNFLKSVEEERNPFEAVFRDRGQIRRLGEMRDRLEEFNAFARRYGFKDYEDYIAVWGRILVGQTELWAADMMKGTREMLEQNIKTAEEELKKPGVTPEMRQMYEEQIKSSRESLAEMNKSTEGTLNKADLALVEKYRPQIEEAVKKYQKTPG